MQGALGIIIHEEVLTIVGVTGGGLASPGEVHDMSWPSSASREVVLPVALSARFTSPPAAASTSCVTFLAHALTLFFDRHKKSLWLRTHLTTFIYRSQLAIALHTNLSDEISHGRKT